MLSLSRIRIPALIVLVPIATFSTAADLPRETTPERQDQDRFRLRLSVPLRQKNFLRLELDPTKETPPPTTSEDSPVQRIERPRGGLGAPPDAPSWSDSSEHPELRSFPPLGTEPEWERDEGPGIVPFERSPDDAPPLDRGFEAGQTAIPEARSRSWERFWEELWHGELHLWSLHVYGGQDFDDNLGEVLHGQTHRHPSGLASVGVVRDGGAYFGLHRDAWWWPTWEVEYTYTRRFENTAVNEHNIVPLRARWDLPLGDTLSRHLELSLAVSEGVSIADDVPNVEVRDDESSHQIQNFLAFDLIVGLPFLERFQSFAKNTNLFFRIHHRSDVYGLYPEEGGSNTLTVGVSVGHRRSERRWQERATSR